MFIDYGDSEIYHDTQTEANGTIELENMKERTREWINLFEHKSFDPVDHCEDESIDCGNSEVYYDTQTEANGTIKLENIKERTREWVNFFEHKSFDPVDHCEDEFIDYGDSEIYYDTQTNPLLPSEFSNITSPTDITAAKIINRNCRKEDPCGDLDKQEVNPDSKDARYRLTEHGEEYSGDSEIYSSDSLLRRKVISDTQIKAKTTIEMEDIKERTEKIRRAVVNYQISAKVIKKIGYITKKGKKLVIPDLVLIERSTVKPTTDDSSKHRTSLNNMGIDVMNEDLEGHYDSALGTLVFNKTGLPTTDCEQYRSIAEIEKGLLFKSKLGEFSILGYTREKETIAVTIDQQTKSREEPCIGQEYQMSKYCCWKQKKNFRITNI